MDKKETRTYTLVLVSKISLRNKRSQIKIQQMAFMLMALTLFFVLIGLIFMAVQLSGVRESATNLEKENAEKLIMKIANSPEFSCGESFGTAKIDCVDFDKIIVFRDMVSDYSKFWGVADIEIVKLYPEASQTTCSYRNYPDCKTTRIYSENVKKKPPISNFVSLCRKDVVNEEVLEICELARINIRYEDKR